MYVLIDFFIIKKESRFILLSRSAANGGILSLVSNCMTVED